MTPAPGDGEAAVRLADRRGEETGRLRRFLAGRWNKRSSRSDAVRCRRRAIRSIRRPCRGPATKGRSRSPSWHPSPCRPGRTRPSRPAAPAAPRSHPPGCDRTWGPASVTSALSRDPELDRAGHTQRRRLPGNRDRRDRSMAAELPLITERHRQSDGNRACNRLCTKIVPSVRSARGAPNVVFCRIAIFWRMRGQVK